MHKIYSACEEEQSKKEGQLIEQRNRIQELEGQVKKEQQQTAELLLTLTTKSTFVEDQLKNVNTCLVEGFNGSINRIARYI